MSFNGLSKSPADFEVIERQLTTGKIGLHDSAKRLGVSTSGAAHPFELG